MLHYILISILVLNQLNIPRTNQVETGTTGILMLELLILYGFCTCVYNQYWHIAFFPLLSNLNIKVMVALQMNWKVSPFFILRIVTKLESFLGVWLEMPAGLRFLLVRRLKFLNDLHIFYLFLSLLWLCMFLRNLSNFSFVIQIWPLFILVKVEFKIFSNCYLNFLLDPWVIWRWVS